MMSYFMQSPVGLIGLNEEDGFITALFFASAGEEAGEPRTDVPPVVELAVRQLEEYFDKRREVFCLPLRLTGTEFQKKVWNALLEIPYGETRSYKEIAAAAGNANASRAVGLANNRNPISIIVPCHRVIGSNGKLVGYGGGLAAKQKLLDLELKSHPRE